MKKITPCLSFANLLKAVVNCSMFLMVITSYAQEVKIPMQAQAWEYDSSKVEFAKHASVDAIKGKNGAYYQVFLKNQVFANGTIEFDVALTGMGFPGINFRMSDDRKNGENFYIRSFGPVNPRIRTTVQYAAIIDGMSIWDLSDEYQSGATIYQQGWNHVKLVVSGKQMLAYVNDMKNPALAVPELEGWRESGHISLSGNVIYANLVLKPGVTEGLPSQAAYNITRNDTRYLRNWQVSPSKVFSFGKDVVMPLPSMYGKLQQSELPDSTVQWSAIKAEPRGIVNLSRKYGAVIDDGRRLAWLKTTINSDKVQQRTLSLGFSDEVWIFLNGSILYSGKNYFGTPSQKNGGRCIIENATLQLPLQQGKNEILIGLANYFYGWGLIARLDEMDGLTTE
ncbi:hypothetical protein [Foetidibacter luteolus]|uniref:hypothetical protein n=1 Tax=Foetidibacter luteolus TaxID=2608880 RepID=UPI00129A7CF4|nr:hypothetical protein [Foetidibacter luteolus]